MNELYWSTLASERWQQLKWRAILRAQFRCEECGRRYRGRRVRGAMRVFRLHHRHYETVGSEQFEDVEVVCPPCHKIIHGIEDDDLTEEGW